MSALLSVQDLSVAYGPTTVIDKLSFSIEPGEIVALVGRSGTGKSTIINALDGLLAPGAIVSGQVHLNGESLLDGNWAGIRGRKIGLIPQDPFGWFDPVYRVGRQMRELVTNARADELLMQAGLAAHAVNRSYPHQLSGGMLQRASIAAALAHEPSLLLADEPTSTLDFELQGQILDLLRLLPTSGRSLLIVTHDPSIVATLADRVISLDPTPPPTPRAVSRNPRMEGENAHTVVELAGVTKKFGRKTVVDNVSLEVKPGRTLGVVGASGSGKTTLARLITGLEKPTKGSVIVDRNSVGLVFQDSAGSLDPRFSVRRCIGEPLRRSSLTVAVKAQRIIEVAAAVGLGVELLSRHPAELSGGQRQRVGIARALVAQPKAIVLDEPTSALDSQTRDEILQLLADLQSSLNIAYVLISHDTAVVTSMSDAILQM